MTEPVPGQPLSRSLPFAHGDLALRSAGSGSPLVLLHHDVGSHGWTAFHDALTRQFTVFALDLPGFGESARADWARHPRDLAAIVIAAARRLGLRDYHLAGLGFGGWVAAEVASFAHTELSALTLVAPAGVKPEDAFILDQVLEEPVAYLRAGFSRPHVFEQHYPDARDKALRERLDRARETIARVSWKPYMYSYELPETLREVPTPTTVVWGESDAVIPPATAGLWARTLPDCAVHTFPATGHFVELEEPERLAALICSSARVPQEA